MNKSLIDLITKISLCGILVLILVVLFNIIKEPYSFQSNDYDSKEDIKKAYLRTKKVGAELDKDLLDKYLDDLKAPTRDEIESAQTPKKNEYYVPLPKEVSVVGYGRGDELKKPQNKK